jgi:DNA-binding CsgD family transcriptional regulator
MPAATGHSIKRSSSRGLDMWDVESEAVALRPTTRYLGPERRAACPSQWLVRMLDEADHGMVLVGHGGRLRHANRAAREELAGEQSLKVEAGRVQPAQADQVADFRQALVDASHGRRRLVWLGESPALLPVASVPLNNQSGGDAAALLLLGRRSTRDTLSLDFFARSQGLTAAEGRVLQALCDGLRPKEVAVQTGVAVSTVRTQISSIRQKTRTASIGELLRLVSALPPISPLALGGGAWH